MVLDNNDHNYLNQAEGYEDTSQIYVGRKVYYIVTFASTGLTWIPLHL